MAYGFLDIASTPGVRAAQEANGSGEYWANFHGDRAFDRFTEAEAAFIAERDSFYMASVTEDGWPYVQHRGGQRGFLHVLSPSQLAFADYKGNRQMLSTSNLSANDRVALFLMDYPERNRLKILGHARIKDARDHPELVSQLAEKEVQPIVERFFIIDVVAFDWNCPKYIVPRFTEAQVRTVVDPLVKRIKDLEAELARLSPKT